MSRSVNAAGGAGAAAVCAVLLAACGSPAPRSAGAPPARSVSTPASAHASAHASGATVPASAQASTPPRPCTSSRLTVTVDSGQGSAAAGSAYYPIDFTNTAASPCTLFGYPGVSFVTRRGGTRLGAAAVRDSAAPAARIMLPPGGTAHAVLQVVNAGNYSASDCHPVTAHWLRVYPPGQTAPAYASFTAQVCSAHMPASLGNSLAVYPVRGGKGGRGQAP